MLTSPEAAVHIGNIYASFNTGCWSHGLLTTWHIYSSVVRVHDQMCIGGLIVQCLAMLLSRYYISLSFVNVRKILNLIDDFGLG